MIGVAQCLRVNENSYCSFIADQISNLKRYESVIFTYHDGYQPGYGSIPIYAPYWSKNFWPTRTFNRLTRKVFHSPWWFTQAIRRHNIHLFHAHFATHAIDFIPQVKKFGLPLVVSTYGYDVSSAPRVWPYYGQHLPDLVDAATLFLAMSEDMRRDLIGLGCPADKILVHHTAVDVDRFSYKTPRSSDSRLRILTICTYQKRRGLPYLIRAFAEVLKSYPQIELRIVGRPMEQNVYAIQGEKPYEQQAVSREVDALVRELNLDGYVTQTGRVEYSRLVAEYHNADVFALPSVTGSFDRDKEGIPTVLLEAQATGLPVVSTRHAGIPEAVLDGQSGYLMDERDIGALAEKLCLLLAERYLRERMGMTGRKHIEKEFNIVTQVQKLERIYDRLVEGQWK